MGEWDEVSTVTQDLLETRNNQRTGFVKDLVNYKPLKYRNL